MSLCGVATGARLHAADLSPLRRLSEAGADFVRWGPRWDTVEKTLGGGYDFADTDKIVGFCDALGLSLIYTVAGRDNANNTHAVEYAAYALACAQRYAGKVIAFELGNEPNHIIWSSVPSAAGYTALLKRAYSTVKAKVPTAVLLTAGMGGAQNDAGDGDAADFVEQMYVAGAQGYFDALAFHPYCPGTFADSLLTQSGGAWRMWRARQSMKAHGDKAKQIWVTEFGVPTGGTGPHVTESQQAAILYEGFSWMAARKWCGPAAWFDHQDDPTPTPSNHGDYCGLWRADWSVKPALAVFSALATAT